MDSVPPVHGPARSLDPLDQVLADLDHDGPDDEQDTDEDAARPDLPEVVEAVTGRARDLHLLADRLSAEQGADSSLSAVALLRAHAGAVGDLADHLQAAGEERDQPATADTTTGADATGPDPSDPADPADGSSGPRGVPRHAG